MASCPPSHSDSHPEESNPIPVEGKALVQIDVNLYLALLTQERSVATVRNCTFLRGKPSNVVFLTHTLGMPTEMMLLKRWIS